MAEIVNLVFSMMIFVFIIGFAFAVIFRQGAGASSFTRWYFRSIGHAVGWCLRQLANLFDRRPPRR